MNEYEQILQRAKEQGIDFDGKDIIIPITENKLMLNGTIRIGRVFDNAVYVMGYDFDSEPFIYRIIDRYNTWVTSGSMLVRIDFYVVE